MEPMSKHGIHLCFIYIYILSLRIILYIIFSAPAFWLGPLWSGVEFSTSDALTVFKKFQILGLGLLSLDVCILMHLSKAVYFPYCSFLAPFLLSASPLDLLACFSIITFLIHIFHVVQIFYLHYYHYFELGFHCIAHAGLKLVILNSYPPG